MGSSWWRDGDCYRLGGLVVAVAVLVVVSSLLLVVELALVTAGLVPEPVGVAVLLLVELAVALALLELPAAVDRRSTRAGREAPAVG